MAWLRPSPLTPHPLSSSLCCQWVLTEPHTELLTGPARSCLPLLLLTNHGHLKFSALMCLCVICLSAIYSFLLLGLAVTKPFAYESKRG